jgi:putative spermidine/putrescine transport system ATP-binding protein
VTTIYVTHDQQEALALSDRIVVMRLGHIQQIGAPGQVYADPANLFVADFMGFKNIWDAVPGSLRENGDSLDAELTVKGLRLKARLRYLKGDPRRDALVAAFKAGTAVKTAIRPEDIRVGRDETGSPVRSRVTLVEYQGQTSYVSALMENETLVELRPSNAEVRIGETLELNIAPEKVFVFAPGGG